MSNNDKDQIPSVLIPLMKISKDAIAAIYAGKAAEAGGNGIEIPKGLIGTSNNSTARMLVDLYYTMQEVRKAVSNQCGAASRGADPTATNEANRYMLAQVELLEQNAASWLHVYVQGHPMWPWLNAVHGIGPILAAGLVAHLGSRSLPPTVGHWWRYAGLDPSQQWLGADALRAKWEAIPGDVDMRTRTLSLIVGRDPETVIRDATVDNKTGDVKPLTRANALKSLARIPFNRPLKTLMWKIGDSFVKLGERNDSAFYPKFYRRRKAEEVARNESGGRRELAAKTLAEKPMHAQRAIYAEGKLPDGRIDLMARRATVKLFLSHMHEIWWLVERGEAPPKPFSMSIQGHAHYIPPPYMHVVDEAKKAA